MAPPGDFGVDCLSLSLRVMISGIDFWRCRSPKTQRYQASVIISIMLSYADRLLYGV
jgi:hypothetical protein